jgi:plastocyanin
MCWVNRMVLGAAVALGAPAVTAAELRVNVGDASGRALDDAVVALLPQGAPPPLPAGAQAVIEQRARQFHPRVTVVQTGTAVQFPNHDTVRHHVYSFSPIKPFEIKLYVGTPAQPVVFDKPGTAVLGCNIHDNMVAWVHVVDTPWFAMTRDGVAHITDAPAGAYQLQVWHPRWPEGRAPHRQPVVLDARGAAVSVKLEVAP